MGMPTGWFACKEGSDVCGTTGAVGGNPWPPTCGTCGQCAWISATSSGKANRNWATCKCLKS
eukprot:8649642-Prorocentrum_lima.AAC.1